MIRDAQNQEEFAINLSQIKMTRSETRNNVTQKWMTNFTYPTV